MVSVNCPSTRAAFASVPFAWFVGMMAVSRVTLVQLTLFPPQRSRDACAWESASKPGSSGRISSAGVASTGKAPPAKTFHSFIESSLFGVLSQPRVLLEVMEVYTLQNTATVPRLW